MSHRWSKEACFLVGQSWLCIRLLLYSVFCVEVTVNPRFQDMISLSFENFKSKSLLHINSICFSYYKVPGLTLLNRLWISHSSSFKRKTSVHLRPCIAFLHWASLFFFFFFFFFFGCIGSSSLCAGFSCGKRGLLFFAVHGLLVAVASRCGAQALGAWASVVVARGLSSCGSQALEHRLRSCGARAQLLRSMWDLPGPGLEPMSPALAGEFLTTVPSGKSQRRVFFKIFIYLFILSCAGSLFLCQGFLLLRQVGATLHRGARASHYRGLSCCGAQAPDAQAQ